MAEEQHVEETGPERRPASLFSVDRALNTPGFAEFLTQYDKADELEPDESNAEMIEQRFNAFQFSKEAIVQLKELYKETILQDTGIELQDQDLQTIDGYIRMEAIRAPETIKGILDRVNKFKALPEIITRTEGTIERLGNVNLGELRTKREELELAVALSELTRRERTNEQRQVQQYLLDKYGLKAKNAAQAIEQTRATIRETEDARRAQAEAHQRFAELRGEFFNEDFWQIRAIINEARYKAREQLTALANDEDPAKFEKALEYIARLSQKDAEGNTALNFDYLEGTELRKRQEEIDAAIEAKMGDEIRQTIEAFTLGSTPLLALEKALKTFLTRERVGSREGDEAREIIRTKVREALPHADPAKRILLKRILIRTIR